jgi:hypothetical protein
MKVIKTAALQSPEIRHFNLVIDGMSIKKALDIVSGKISPDGYCDYGPNLQVEKGDLLAGEALVFMLVSLNGSVKWPIAYFLTRGITGETLKTLIETAIQLCHENTLKVWTLTCDGHATNYKAMKLFNCDVFAGSIHLITNRFKVANVPGEIYFTPDACHSLKLARNALEEYDFVAPNGNVISWIYIVKLLEFQEKMVFRLANKLIITHINFKRNIMKVCTSSSITEYS